MVAENSGTRYRFVHKDTNSEFPVQQVHYAGEEIQIGDVIEIHAPGSTPVCFTVDSKEAGEIVTVRLVRARSQLWKTFLLLAILGASWFLIASLLKLIF